MLSGDKSIVFIYLYFYLKYSNTIFFIPNCLFQGEGASPDTTFIEDGVHELLKTRRILKCSYPYSFFLEPKSTKKEIFELMQVRGCRLCLLRN